MLERQDKDFECVTLRAGRREMRLLESGEQDVVRFSDHAIAAAAEVIGEVGYDEAGRRPKDLAPL